MKLRLFPTGAPPCGDIAHSGVQSAQARRGQARDAHTELSDLRSPLAQKRPRLGAEMGGFSWEKEDMRKPLEDVVENMRKTIGK